VVLCKNLENLFVLNKEALFVFGGHLNYFLIKFAGILLYTSPGGCMLTFIPLHIAE